MTIHFGADGTSLASGSVGGSTVQCQQGTTGTAKSLSTSYQDSNLSCSITTQKANSKILVHVTQSARGSSGDGQVSWSFKILRGSTVIFSSGGSSNHKYTYFDDDGGGQGNNFGIGGSCHYLDTPNASAGTTYTYKTQCAKNAGSVSVNGNGMTGVITLTEVSN